MTQTVNELMDRLKSLKEYSVEREVPESMALRGVIPFDIKITGTVGIFKLIAASQEEAESKVDDFLVSQQ